MRALVIALAVGAVGWAGLGTAWHMCYIKGNCGFDAVSAAASNGSGDQADSTDGQGDMSDSGTNGTDTTIDPSVNPPLDIMELGDPVFSFDKSPIIKKGEVITEIPEEALALADSMKIWLQANPGKNLEIVGFYDASETNNTKDANIGIARAKYLRDLLVESGLDSKRIVIQGIESDLAFTNDAVCYDAFEMAIIGDGPEGEGEVELVDAPMTEKERQTLLEHKYLYANYGDHKFREDETLNQFISVLKKELEDNPNALVKITGHTDHLGPAKKNLILGQRRADYTKEYFVRHGLSADRIETGSRGEYDPIGENTNRDGRRMNRRIEIIVVK